MIRLILDERIKESGLRKGFIAERLGVNKDTLGNWIAGRSMPKLDQAIKLADILNCKVDDLYERAD